MIFVDTGAWFAVFVPNDSDHAAAEQWLEANREPLSVVCETCGCILANINAKRPTSWRT